MLGEPVKQMDNFREYSVCLKTRHRPYVSLEALL